MDEDLIAWPGEGEQVGRAAEIWERVESLGMAVTGDEWQLPQQGVKGFVHIPMLSAPLGFLPESVPPCLRSLCHIPPRHNSPLWGVPKKPFRKWPTEVLDATSSFPLQQRGHTLHVRQPPDEFFEEDGGLMPGSGEF